MSWFTTHLRAKLLGGFAIVLAVMAAIVALGLSSVDSVADKSTAMAEVDLPSANAIGAIGSNEGNIRVLELMAMDAMGQPKVLDELGAISEQLRGEIDKSFAGYEMSSEADRKGYTKAKAQWEAYKALDQQLLAAVAAGDQKVQTDMSEVAAVAEQSSASSEQVSASTEETSASAQEIASSAQGLARTAEELETLVGRFQLAR